MARTVADAILIDTSVLIDFLRGADAPAEFLDSQRGHVELICSLVSAAELIVGALSRSERKKIDQLLDRLRLEPIMPGDSVRALNWLRKYYPSHGIGFHDCLIAATALRVPAAVVTLNEKHFLCLPNVTVVRPY